MPETAPHLDDRVVTRQDDVGAAGKFSNVQPEAKPSAVQELPDGNLGLRVGSPDPGHHSTSSNSINDVNHGQNAPCGGELQR
jgi:hypothetical protein